MRLLKLTIKYDGDERTFDFSDKTLLFSTNNSVGKSTILRLIFYGLGYPVPGTYGMKFSKVDTQVSFERDNSLFTVMRKENYIEINQDNSFLTSRILTGNDDTWFAYIWGIDSIRVLRNILGAIYMDQDKGWTLLNRGKVIGNIRFNIRDLLVGLSRNGESLENKLVQLQELKSALSRVRQLIELKESTLEYKNSNVESLREKDDTKLIDNYKNLKLKLRVEKQELQKVRKSFLEEENLKNYILSLNIIIDYNGKNIVVDDDNILNFDDNINFLKQKSAIIQENIEQLRIQITETEKILADSTANLFSEVDVVARAFSDISTININHTILSAREEELKSAIASLNDIIEKEFMANNELIDETRDWVNIFAEKLGILDVVKDKKYIFTRDLKSISGTIYYKVVFSFKMAYIKIIEKYTKVKLPIVLDSPSGREVSDRNIAEVIRILNEYFEPNQIIIASINKYDLKNIEEIELVDRIFEN
ncbi:hypothetical protein ACPBEH_07915 [Latilactobacillus sp. 5-91]|uniref:hypothetical protein n=1 Tax=Latilactobacillus sp. 5-91 TaxID=3410924 RepID=UPI003C7380D6